MTPAPAGPTALMSAGPAVGEVEVVLPAGAVKTLLPGAADDVLVLAEGAVKRCWKSRGEKSGDSRVSVHTPSTKVIAYRRTTPRES